MVQSVDPIHSHIIWNEANVIEDALPFLKEKNEQMKLLYNLWKTPNAGPAAKLAGERVKMLAENTYQKVAVLNRTVMQLLDDESRKDPFSEKTKKLITIANASSRGLQFFQSVTKVCFPSTSTNILRNITLGTMFGSGLLIAIGFVAETVVGNNQIPDLLQTAFRVSLQTCVISMFTLVPYAIATTPNLKQSRAFFDNSLEVTT